MYKPFALLALVAIAGAVVANPFLSRPIVQGSGIVENANGETGAFRIDIRRGFFGPSGPGIQGTFRFARLNANASAPSMQLETTVRSAALSGNQANFAGPTRVIIRNNNGAPTFAIGMLQGIAVDNRAPNDTAGDPDTLSFVFNGASLNGPISFSGDVVNGDIRVAQFNAPRKALH
ncbi:MAG: hypothetical protein ACK4P3_08480 [Fimbriimonadaceae bacterium]